MRPFSATWWNPSVGAEIARKVARRALQGHFVEATIPENEMPLETNRANLLCGSVETCIEKTVRELQALNLQELILHVQTGAEEGDALA